MASTDYDLIIVGGGMVGASLACALSNTDLRIALVEAFNFKQDQQPSYDDRGIALAYGTQRIFEAMGLWSQLATHTTPISDIHISDRGHFGVTRLSAKQENVPALGQVITARLLGQAFNQSISQQTNLTVISPVSVTDLEQSDDDVSLSLSNGETLTTKLVVAADGGNSTIRKLLSLGAFEHDYQQTAVTANVTTQRPHHGKAFERFTDTGPMALLPMSENRSSLVWTVNAGDETELLALEDDAFLQALQTRFGYRLGKFTRVGQRHSYPLKLIHSDQPVQHRIVLIGNAAHNLHPIAGQGFNLGLRDVAALADVLVSPDNHDCGAPALLHDYKQWRQADQDNVIEATSSLVNIFSNDSFLLGHARSLGLSMLDTLPFIKHQLARSSMGLKGKQPRLARGISL